MADDLADTLVTFLQNDGIGGKRPVHAWGFGAAGYFEPSHVARDFCTAEHFQDARGDGNDAAPVRIPVKVRYSNGSGTRKNDGSLGPHDAWSDVRGMAVRFFLTNGASTDLIAMSLPEFFTPTPEAFEDFAKEALPRPFARESAWQKFCDMLRLTLPMPDPYPGQTDRPDDGALRYADKVNSAKLAVFQAAAIGAPVSYARLTYHAVHAFFVTAPDGARRGVRFTWQPIAGALNIDLRDPAQRAKYLPHPYLAAELQSRLAAGPARFSLMMMIGETGDDFNDSSRPWPPHRVRVMMGTLTLLSVEDCEDMSFNPLHLTPGIEPSGDPVLWVREEAYKLSSQRRGGIPCPFSGATRND